MEMWGCQPTSEAEVRSVFSSYYGPPDNSVRRLPWRDSQPEQESQEDLGRLEQFSREGFLAINFLPAANCVDSRDQARGWGTRPGYVFQVRQHQRDTSSLYLLLFRKLTWSSSPRRRRSLLCLRLSRPSLESPSWPSTEPG